VFEEIGRSNRRNKEDAEVFDASVVTAIGCRNDRPKVTLVTSPPALDSSNALHYA
jgi:hypothetical protein